MTELGYYFATHINLCDKLQSTNTFGRLKLGVVRGGGMKTYKIIRKTISSMISGLLGLLQPIHFSVPKSEIFRAFRV